MNIWIINPYGELPSGEWREYRSYMLAKELVESGHSVSWWISNFDHRTKTFREAPDSEVECVRAQLNIFSVPCIAYNKNISLRRILYEVKFGRELYKIAQTQIKPDLIVLAYPAIFTGGPIFKLKKELSVPLILDVIDLWPELFSVVLPRLLKRFSRIIFFPLYWLRKKQVQASDGIVAVSKDYLEVSKNEAISDVQSQVVYWGLNSNTDHNMPLDQALDDRVTSFRQRFDLVAVYAGTLGDAYDMDLLLSASDYCDKNGISIGFIVAGNGPRFSDFQSHDRFTDNLCFLGILPANQLSALYSFCDVGLITYVPGSTVAMPIKFFDYLGAGIAILNCLGRDVGALTISEGVGLNFEASNMLDFIDKLKVFLKDRALLGSCQTASKTISKKYDVKTQYGLFREFIETYER